ncbi:lipopolysaccharide heptosyltransferase II [Vibrio ponticus]|uniref:lipopolysaccharide heptosyltransferase II n=1 Tax=Vibrio ponticus TaxID=265668 RepID=A0A3N3DUR5_9VIBR|nr:lipopolysaccharide heptosyltransferase II [Vibrio ponticus]ROV58136.1 lipopolysaccharide heptosyltransferase II [Vibrio ponticus]
MNKILIIGPSWVGDMVMSQSLYITLKQLYPASQIDVLAPGWCKPILERMPEVNKALEMPLGHGDFNLLARRKIGIELRTEQYDHAFVLPKSAKSALIPWFANIPVRTGWKGEMRFGLLNDIRSNMSEFEYMVERYVALAYPRETMRNSSSLGGLEQLAKPKLFIDKIAQQHTLAKYSLSTPQVAVGLCPGAEFGPAKKWPEDKYAETATHLAKQGKQVWLFGSQKDVETCEGIKALVNTELQSNIHVLAGKTSLIEAIDLLAACETVISNDSGLMHVAAAVGCHVIGIYGSTSPRYTPPLAEKVDIVSIELECRPCFKRECPLGHLNCLKNLPATSVINKI